MDDQIEYNPELAMRFLADKLAQSELENATLRASLSYYKGLVSQSPSDNLSSPVSPLDTRSP